MRERVAGGLEDSSLICSVAEWFSSDSGLLERKLGRNLSMDCFWRPRAPTGVLVRDFPYLCGLAPAVLGFAIDDLAWMHRLGEHEKEGNRAVRLAVWSEKDDYDTTLRQYISAHLTCQVHAPAPRVLLLCR